MTIIKRDSHMKNFRTIALVSAIAAVTAGAQAELKALDDSTMGELTGQAGLTIDVETKWSIGEFMYKDAGSLLIRGISMGGNTLAAGGGSYLDNIRLTIDIAGAGVANDFGDVDNTFNYGFSEIVGLSQVLVANGNSDAGILTASAGSDADNGIAADTKKFYGDGDLVIHFGFSDAFKGGTSNGYRAYANSVGNDASGAAGTVTLSTITYAHASDSATRSVDFNFSIDAIGLASSSYVASAMGTVDWEGIDNYTQTGVDSDATDTILISNIDIRGYYGPEDLHIENDGNGFGNEAGAGAIDHDNDGTLDNNGAADSKITWGNYFRITDLDVYLDIAGLQISDLAIHNDRGDLSGLDGTSSFGFAHSIRTIYAVKDTVLKLDNTNLVRGLLNAIGGANAPILTPGVNPDGYVDGLALNTQFKGDVDIIHMSFGDTEESIGERYVTDLISDSRMTISAH